MSLFGFGDIKFNNNRRSGFGPLAALEGTEFQRTTYRYPLDVGAFDKGHYMVFYIRQQKKTSFTSPEAKESIPVGAANQNPGSEQYWNAKTGSEIGGRLKNGANSISSAVTGNSLGNLGSKISSVTNGALSSLPGSVSSALSNLGSRIKGAANNIFGQTNILKGNSQSTQAVLDTRLKTITNNSFLRTTKLTTDAIALYMPDTLLFEHQQSYSSMELGESTAGKIAGIAKSAMDASKGSILKGAASGTAEILGQLGAEISKGVVGEDATRAGLAAIGFAQNPMLEMVYQSPNFRTFQFDFMFYPRSEQEALEVQKILDRFKFHQAPEFAGNGQTFSTFLVPPSEFDIKFYYGAGENPNIPRISDSCVLENISINYAPNGWSSYEVPGENIASRGRTGMPTAIQLTLQFKETTYLTKADLRKDDAGLRVEVDTVD